MGYNLDQTNVKVKDKGLYLVMYIQRAIILKITFIKPLKQDEQHVIRRVYSVMGEATDLESNIFVDELFNVAANSRVGSDNLAEMQFVKSSGFTSVIQTNNNDLILFCWE